MSKTKKDMHIEKLLKQKSGIKLDLACGGSKQDGWVGMDILDFKGVDIIHDIETYPYPLPDNSCQVIMASHIIEHINPAKFGFVDFMNECWRIMQPDGEMIIATPYAGSQGYYQDPTHCNPCNEITFTYFDPLSPTGLYRFYTPKPWKIADSFWTPNGNLEVKLIKRRIDKSYGTTTK